MRKTFSFHVPGKAEARVLDAIKHEVRKYVQRERRKPLPAGFDRWNFACQVGISSASAEEVALEDMSRAIDRVAAGGSSEVFLAIVATPATPRAKDGLV